MKKNENTKLNRSWMAAFSVATTAFAAHAGGGFATGNQENTWFVSLGWPAIVGVAVAMLLLAMTIREGQIMMNSRGLKTYKELFECLFHPFDKVELLFELFFNILYFWSSQCINTILWIELLSRNICDWTCCIVFNDFWSRLNS